MTGPVTEKTLRLGFVGDISLGSSVRAGLAAAGLETPFSSAAPLFAGFDITIANLEGAAARGHDGKRDSRPGLAAKTDDLRLLAEAGIDVVTLANNHVMDEGRQGLEAATDALERFGVAHVGAGFDRPQAERTLCRERGGKRIAFIAACDHAIHWARGDKAGIAPLGWRRVARRVREAHRANDVVIVLLHADYEFAECPSPARIARSRALIDEGATLVIQHHPHVWQGIERHGDGLIAYSLGNFVFPVHGNPYQARHPGTEATHVLEVSLTFGDTGTPSIEWRAHPFIIRETHTPTPASARESRALLAELHRRSALLADPAAVSRQHRAMAWREWRNIRNAFLHALARRRLRACLALAGRCLIQPVERDAIVATLRHGRR